MSDFLHYLKAQSDTKAARAEYNRASESLELAQIKERLAEMKSQHVPLAALVETAMTERERLYAAAHFVVVGRLPS